MDADGEESHDFKHAMSEGNKAASRFHGDAQESGVRIGGGEGFDA